MENLSSINRTASSCGTLPGQGAVAYQQPYTFYSYLPNYTLAPAPAPVKPTARELIALYKKEFGKEWKKMF